jgi:hypothetical protein
MPFEITSVKRFSAAHSLRLHDGSFEPVHGHNWTVKITVAADRLDAIGVVMDFHELDRLLEVIVSPWHNRPLNQTPPSTPSTPRPKTSRPRLLSAFACRPVCVWSAWRLGRPRTTRRSSDRDNAARRVTCASRPSAVGCR